MLFDKNGNDVIVQVMYYFTDGLSGRCVVFSFSKAGLLNEIIIRICYL